MRKKIIKIIPMFIVFCIGVIYTENSIQFIRQYDPIMQEILEIKDEYYVEPILNVINDTTFIPGLNGIEVDVNKSYLNMKQNGIYDNSLLVYSEVELDDKYDNSKYISNANPLKKSVSLIIKLDNQLYLDEILNILKEKNIIVNFFVDKKIASQEINDKIINNLHNINYYYSSDYEKNVIDLTGEKYCLFLKEDDNLLENCAKNNKISILPNIIGYELLYLNVITELNYGSLILIDNLNNLSQINQTIDFIKQKGMSIITLEEHLDNKNCLLNNCK